MMSVYKSPMLLACTVLSGVMFAGAANSQTKIASYAAKFSCGATPPSGGDTQDVVSGDYASSINISNPNNDKVVFDKELVFAQEEGVPPCQPIFIKTDSLAGGSAERVDCSLINKHINQCFKFLAPVHVEGFVRLSYLTNCLDANCGRVVNPLDVVGYYSARTSATTAAYSSPSVDVVVYPVQITFPNPVIINPEG